MHLELEKLINIAIQDGILNERERQILISKARALGIDEHEFEMTLEGVMSKLQNNNDGLTKNSQIVRHALLLLPLRIRGDRGGV